MKVWHLVSGTGEVALADNPGGPPVMVVLGQYYGPESNRQVEDFDHYYYRRPVPNASLDEDVAPGTLVTTAGLGHFGTPSVAGCSADGTNWLLAFETLSVEVGESSMTVHLGDAVAGLELDVLFEIPSSEGCIEQTLTLRNVGSQAFRVDRLMATFVVPPGFDQVLTFAGRWGMEFQERRESLGISTWSRTNRRGRTSHDSYPGVIALGREGSHGPEAYGVQLGWSGNHEILIEPIDDGRRTLQIGEHWEPGEVVLAPGEAVSTPTAYHVYAASNGVRGVRLTFHEHARARILKWPWPDAQTRPVTLNTWEANYFATGRGADSGSRRKLPPRWASSGSSWTTAGSRAGATTGARSATGRRIRRSFRLVWRRWPITSTAWACSSACGSSRKWSVPTAISIGPIPTGRCRWRAGRCSPRAISWSSISRAPRSATICSPASTTCSGRPPSATSNGT